MADYFAACGNVAGDNGKARGHGFEEGIGHSFGEGREGEGVGGCEERGHV